MNKILLILVLVTLSIVCDGQRAPRRRKRPNCHMKQIDRCMEKMEQLGSKPDASNIMTTEEGIEELCSTTIGVTDCIKGYMRKCATPIQRELFEFLHEQLVESVKQFCNDGQNKQTFLRHSPCINEKVIRSKKYHKVCVNDVMAAIYKGQEMVNKTVDDPELFNLENSAAKGVSDMVLDLSCCSYNRYDDCTNNYITEECGADAVEAMNEFTTKTFGGGMNMFCPRAAFEPNSTLCLDIVPPTGSDPHRATLLNNPLGKYTLSYLNFLFNFDVNDDSDDVTSSTAAP